jgi:hypothetical protein
MVTEITLLGRDYIRTPQRNIFSLQTWEGKSKQCIDGYSHFENVVVPSERRPCTNFSVWVVLLLFLPIIVIYSVLFIYCDQYIWHYMVVVLWTRHLIQAVSKYADIINFICVIFISWSQNSCFKMATIWDIVPCSVIENDHIRAVVELVGTSETLVNLQETTECSILESWHLHTGCIENFKSQCMDLLGTVSLQGVIQLFQSTEVQGLFMSRHIRN